MPFHAFTIPLPAGNFLNGADTIDIAHFLPYLLPGYVANAGTYGADLFGDVPPYVDADQNRVGTDFTTDDDGVRAWLGYERPYARIQCAYCQAYPCPGTPGCPTGANRVRPRHRPTWVRCANDAVGAARHDFWSAACGSFACLGRTAVANVAAPLELCDLIVNRDEQAHVTSIRVPDANADLDLGGGGVVDNARLVALQALLDATLTDPWGGWDNWTANRRAFHHALLRLQLDLYGFTTAAGALANGEVGIATHASNWYSFDHFGIKTQVAAVGGNVTVYTQKVTDSPVNFFGNSLWDEGYEETVVKVTRVPVGIAWVLSAMHA